MTKLVGIMSLAMVLVACACASPTLPQQDAGAAPDTSQSAPAAPDASQSASDHVDLPPVQEEL